MITNLPNGESTIGLSVASRVLMLTLCTAASVGAHGHEPSSAPGKSTEECAVWGRELSFARSVADHDAGAFVEHIAEDAVFDVGKSEPMRGRDTIARLWTDIVAGKGIRPRWYPTSVVLSGHGNLAWSTGPVLIENPDAKAGERYQVATFRSVWRKGEDGVWRVLFDDGGTAKNAKAADVKSFDSGQRECM